MSSANNKLARLKAPEAVNYRCAVQQDTVQDRLVYEHSAQRTERNIFA
jgi:hypothetical protein